MVCRSEGAPLLSDVIWRLDAPLSDIRDVARAALGISKWERDLQGGGERSVRISCLVATTRREHKLNMGKT